MINLNPGVGARIEHVDIGNNEGDDAIDDARGWHVGESLRRVGRIDPETRVHIEHLDGGELQTVAAHAADEDELVIHHGYCHVPPRLS